MTSLRLCIDGFRDSSIVFTYNLVSLGSLW